MANDKSLQQYESEPNNCHFLVYQAEDGKLKMDVRFEDESVWLTQQMMAELFQTTKQNISLHIQNIFDEGELSSKATVKEYLTVRLAEKEYDKFHDKRLMDSIKSLNDFDKVVKQLETSRKKGGKKHG